VFLQHDPGFAVVKILHLASLLALLLLLCPLSDTVPAAAKRAYDHAWRLFEQGYLAASQRESELAFRQFQISDPSSAAKFRLLDAEAMLYRGMYDDSLSTLNSDYEFGNRDSAVEKLAIEAVAYTRQGQLTLAGDRIAQAQAMCIAWIAQSCGEVLSARALLAIKVGNLDEARAFFLKALAFARADNDRWLEANTVLNLGYIALQVDHYDEAVDWSKTSYDRAVAFGFENIAQGAAGNLGWAYYQLGDRERALKQFIDAEHSAERLGNSRYELKWVSTAGYIYQDAGDYTQASQSFRQALYLARKIDSKEDIVNALEDLAQVSVRNGNLQDADNYISELTKSEIVGGERQSADLSMTSCMLKEARHELSTAESCFHLLQNNSAAPTTIRLDAGYGLAALLESEGKSEAAEESYKATLTAYESARQTIKNEDSRLPFGANATRIYDSYIHLLMQEGRSEEALVTADQSRARTLEQELDVDVSAKSPQILRVNPKQIAQKTNATLLFYWLGAKQSYLWIVTPARVAAVTLPPQEEIAARVAKYRRTILALRDPRRADDVNGQALYKMLVGPAIPLIESVKQTLPAKPVVILADGELNELNFETLLVPGKSVEQEARTAPIGDEVQTHYLIDDLTVFSAPSLAMLGSSKSVVDRGTKLLLLGDPVSPNDEFPTLPLFGLEMSKIQGHFKNQRVAMFAGKYATPEAYVSSNPSQYSYIHFVSHAIANRTDPLDSAIVLSKPTSDENSFKLYAREIIRHPINAKLVTISACYGSGTRFYAGEGLVGLSWAFLRAGAQRVVGALWEVSDDSTPRLMDSLYGNLAEGNTPAVSLRKAKLALLHSQTRFSLPFYWATFQMYQRR